MDFQESLQQFVKIHRDYGPVMDAWLLTYARIIGFVAFAPVFSRKDVPFIGKNALAIFLTCVILWVIPKEMVHPNTSGHVGWLLVEVMVNGTLGFIVGFMAMMIKQAIDSAGDLMTNQIGLSSAMVMNPASRQQVMLLNNLFSILGTVIFIYLGGMHWLINALVKSFEIFPLFALNPHLEQHINLDYIVTLSSNVLVVAVQLVSPVIITTMSVDIILGVVNRAAQQMPVFQLSFALKPAIGVAILLLTLPIFMNAMANHIEDFKKIF